MKRSLSLRREQLAELTTAELREVAGGQSAPGATCNCPDYTYYCTTGTTGTTTLQDSRLVCS